MTALSFVVECPTRASNAREFPMARHKRVKMERDALAYAWSFSMAHATRTGLFARSTVRRRPRGLTREEIAMLKATKAKIPEKVLKPLCRLVVKLTRIASKKLDDDNLRAALKAMRDEIAWQMGVDDRDPLVTWDYDSPGQQISETGYEAVRVVIEPLVDEGARR